MKMTSHWLHYVLLVLTFVLAAATELKNVRGSRRNIRSRGVADLTLVPTPPAPCPDGMPFCDSTEDYPKELIQSILEKQPKKILDLYFPEVPKDPEFDVNKWLGNSGPNDQELCESKTENYYPTRVRKGDTGPYEFVVNTETHRQGVRLERCKNINRECNILGALPLSYSSACVQKYITRFLVVVNQTAEGFDGFVTKPYDFPSCCSCLLTFTGDN